MIQTVLKATLELPAGWAVGAESADGSEVNALITDRDGKPWVPPSTLAGSLKSHLCGQGADDADRRLMGSAPPKSRKESENLVPSALWVVGTKVIGASGGSPRADTVASTAIDPKRAAARPQSLRYTAAVIDNTTVELFMVYEGRLTEADRAVLGSWSPAVGRKRTTGGGHARLKKLGIREFDVSTDAGLSAWLTLQGPKRFTGLTPINVVTIEAVQALPTMTFEIVDALHIGSGRRNGNVAEMRKRGAHAVIPGSSWKGLFRARAGYILRTVGGEQSACTEQTGCGTCLLCDLFGSTVRRGRVAFHDSVVQGTAIQRTHVAIDRVTGGSRDKLLFTQRILTAGSVPLTVTALAPIDDWEVVLLKHVIRDLHDGLIGIGAGTTRGQGTLRLNPASEAEIADLQPVAIPEPVVGSS